MESVSPSNQPIAATQLLNEILSAQTRELKIVKRARVEEQKHASKLKKELFELEGFRKKMSQKQEKGKHKSKKQKAKSKKRK